MKNKVSNEGFEKHIKFIKDHQINNIMLAGKANISRSMFCLKLSGKKGNRFTEPQKQAIIQYFDTLKKDLENIP